MNTAINHPARSTWNFHVLFDDKSSVNERSNESSYFFSDTFVETILYAKRNIYCTSFLVEYTNHFAKIPEETNFYSFLDTKNAGDTSKYSGIPKSMLLTPDTLATDFYYPRAVSLIGETDSLLGYAIRAFNDISFFKNIQMPLEGLGFSKCAERIKYLYSTDDIEDDKPLSLESAQGFVQLVENFQDLGEPLLGLFAQGTLSVEWRIADDKHLLVEPLDNEHACFALIGPSIERGGKLRLNGKGSIADVIDILRKNSVDQWQSI